MTTYLPLLITALPMLASGLVYWAGRYGDRRRNQTAVAAVSITTVLAILLFLEVQQGPVTLSLPWFLGFGLTWHVDFIGGLFGLVVNVIWLLSTLFACEYMYHEHARTRFFSFFVFTLGACAGVFLAGDLFSLFLFFELMTFAAYVLVIHEESPAALQAGNVYLYMSVFGGLSLLAAVFLLQHLLGTTAFAPALEAIIAEDINPWYILVMVMFGFGIKAGMLPLHIWLPKAHPVAPSPASALLSALMIKAGAYGFIRFLFTILTPLHDVELWIWSQHFGYLFLWIGALTMLIGGLMAILNNQIKRILAYSSISQMGYILFAVGTGAMLGTRGAFGFAGAWMHMINHAFYKSMFFLMAGAILLQTHDLELKNLGGLRKRMPWAFGFTLVAAAAITAIPGFNGYVSKILIHEGILEAYHLLEWPSLLWLERIFVVSGGLTVAYITKMWMGIFGGPLKEQNSNVQDISVGHRWIFGVYTACILAIGIFAQTRVDQLVIPAATLFPFHHYDINHLTHVPFWVAKELASPAKAYVIGIGLLLFLHLFGSGLKTPVWLSVEYLVYQPLTTGLRRFMQWLGRLQAPTVKMPAWEGLGDLDLSKWFAGGQRRNNGAQEEWTKRQEFIEKVRKERGLEERAFTDKEDSYWDTANLSFDSLILALIIAVALLIFISIGL